LNIIAIDLIPDDIVLDGVETNSVDFEEELVEDLVSTVYHLII